jgi:hypothetical protein
MPPRTKIRAPTRGISFLGRMIQETQKFSIQRHISKPESHLETTAVIQVGNCL